MPKSQLVEFLEYQLELFDMVAFGSNCAIVCLSCAIYEVVYLFIWYRKLPLLPLLETPRLQLSGAQWPRCVGPTVWTQTILPQWSPARMRRRRSRREALLPLESSSMTVTMARLPSLPLSGAVFACRSLAPPKPPRKTWHTGLSLWPNELSSLKLKHSKENE